MSRLLILLVALVLVSCTATPPGAIPRGKVGPSLEALSSWLGTGALDTLRELRLAGRSADYLPSVSSPGRPVVTMFRVFSEIRDLEGEHLRRSSDIVLPQRPDPIAFAELVGPEGAAQSTSDTWQAGSPIQRAEGLLALRYAPERVVQRAIQAGDAEFGRDTIIGGDTLATIGFERGTARLLVSRSGVLRGTEVVHHLPHDAAWGPWGDVRTTTLYGSWASEPGGFRYPRSTLVLRNGIPLREVTLNQVATGSGDGLDSLRIPSELQSRVASWTPPAPTRVDSLGPGVGLVTGPYQVLLVRQAQGLVVIGAPESSGYSRRVLELAGAWSGNAPVAGIVITSAAWPHWGGVREYVARGIPVFVLPHLIDVLRSVVAAPYTIEPDSLAQAPRSPDLRRIEGDLTLGSGEEAIALLPNVGSGAEHDGMVVVFKPSSGLLYGADLYLPARFEPNLWTQRLRELQALADRNGIAPQTVVSIHNPPIPWDSALASLTPPNPH